MKHILAIRQGKGLEATDSISTRQFLSLCDNVGVISSIRTKLGQLVDPTGSGELDLSVHAIFSKLKAE